MLGGTIAGTFLSGTTPGNIYSIPLTAGSWILVGNAYFPSATIQVQLSISVTTNTLDTFSMSMIGTSGTHALNITRCVNVSSSQTWYLVATSGNNVTVTTPSFYAYRIG